MMSDLNLTVLSAEHHTIPSWSTILITGWLWFIGSHVATVFAQQWHDICIIDNLSNSNIDVLTGLEKITNKTIRFAPADITDEHALRQCFDQWWPINLVIHCADKNIVSESCTMPFDYYHHNIVWTIILLRIMKEYHMSNIIFSSTWSLYDTNKALPPYVETDLLDTTNPYSNTKLITERILKDIAMYQWYNIVILRYFNPIGAHHSWLIWEISPWTPNNLLPYVLNVAHKKADNVSIYGDDYETDDWTGVRDYIHVMDVAQAHLYAYAYIQEYISTSSSNQIKVIQWLYDIFNLGTWEWTSVKQIIDLASRITDRPIPYKVVKRRNGDVATSIANPQKAYKVLSRRAEKTVYQAIEDSRKYLQKQQAS